MKPLLTPDDVAQIAAVKRRTVQAWCRDGRLDSINIGSDARPIYRVHRETLEAFLSPSKPAVDDPKKGRVPAKVIAMPESWERLTR